jgi:hypothetical protein
MSDINELEIVSAGLGYRRADYEPFFPRDFSELTEARARIGPSMRKTRPPRKPPTLASVAKHAAKAGIEVTRYEVKPDGTVVVVTGASSADAASTVTDLDTWLKQKNARPA